jgi:Flp pilus assembly protein TadD
MMKPTILSIALVAALGMTAGCSTQSTFSQTSRPTVSLTDAEAQYALGRYYQGQERYEQAIAFYRRALAANPAHAGAHNGLGASLLLAGRHAEAIEQFKAGLQHQPRSAALWNNLGYAYALSGENKLAEIAYKQSLDLDPTDYKTNTNLAKVQQSLGNAEPAPAAMAASAQPDAAQSSAPAVPAMAAAGEQPAPAPAKAAVVAGTTEPSPAVAPQTTTLPASAPQEKVAPVAAAQPTPAIPAAKPEPSAEPAGTGFATAATLVEVAQVAPRIFELNLAERSAAPVATVIPTPAPVVAATRISVPLREDVTNVASVSKDDFVLEIRNGNGVRRMALRTSQYLAGEGYTTKRLTNQRGFNVKVTRIFYLPGYMEEARRLLAHMPKDTVLTETSNMRRGIHVRVVLGKDMVQHQASLDAAPAKIRLAALMH